MAFWGEPGARLDRKDTALDVTIRRHRSWVFTLISPFLFFMPIVYMNEIDKLYVDQTVHYYFWRQFIDGLKRDWENSITPVSRISTSVTRTTLLTVSRLPCCSPRTWDSSPYKASTRVHRNEVLPKSPATSQPSSVCSFMSCVRFSRGITDTISSLKRAQLYVDHSDNLGHILMLSVQLHYIIKRENRLIGLQAVAIAFRCVEIT